MNDKKIKALLDRLHINSVNPGVCTGPDAWIDTGAAAITSYNPTTGEPIAQVIPATPDAYDPVSYTHLRAHETVLDLVCRLLLEKKNKQTTTQ